MRRSASVLALLGCLLHAMMVPWHAAARMPAQFDAQQLAADLQIICHGAGGTTTAEIPVMPGSGDQTDCPVCKGIMGLQLVVLAAAELGLLERQIGRVDLAVSHDDVSPSITFAPRSRGPPRLV